MSHYFENEDLWKLPDSEKISGYETPYMIKNIVNDKELSTEDLTMALCTVKGYIYDYPDKKTAKKAVEILNLAIEHPNAGCVGGKNKDLDNHRYNQYYEVDSNTEARNLATLIIQMHPDMEKEIFDIYKKLSPHLPIYHDLAKISKEHPKAMDLFEDAYNLDLTPSSLSKAADVMNDIISPDNVDRIERMVDGFGYKYLPDYDGDTRYKYNEKSDLRDRISQIKAKNEAIVEYANIEEVSQKREERKKHPVDRLEEKMKFIEKRVNSVKEHMKQNDRFSFEEVNKEREDKIRLSAYKDFSERCE